mmetsp:Transcript_43573/g.52697  ORF Transcript_43573/g.52697 Transcript_43573/m.52697 type:complete len:637 (+) Transcript_43573:122-2032(+)|eukprot:CAMPEP_0197856108 /NCGR_PEP_ID=MMETSP1438-20131217/27914_1 /TAXON_ID=1461541 /ORGANISM="Pterosperma sp., Strain CCMP1384" /LENGTH=636 /DNA_ID=CAMNT_0043471455 /DNA_START=122 /DNA_END=2032 /DNA_ORIENTATION=+
MVSVRFFAAVLLLAPAAYGFYLPGVAPQDYARDDLVNFKVNKISSTKTALPFEYYSLPFCRPDPVVNSAENLGEVLRGDRILNSLYQIQMRLDEKCKVVCKAEVLTADQTKNFKEKIDDEYRINMILDNLPAAMVKYREEGGESVKMYEMGFPIGFKASTEEAGTPKHFLNNHLRFTILYHKDIETDLARIVGFEVQPTSVHHEYKDWDPVNPQLETCSESKHPLDIGSSLPPQLVEEGGEIVFTYDVFFKASDIKWASRWDTYLLMTDDQIHWFSIINSLMIVLFLTGMVAMIMMRTLRRDISQYNELETAEEAQEETGWKLVHGDVFRPPEAYGSLSVYVGTGIQLFGMCLITMCFAVLGFLSPANRGGLMTAMLLLFVLMGLFAGYFSSRMLKMFQGTDWKANTLKTAFHYPGVLFVLFCILNTLIWGQKSSGAVPFGTFIALFLMWFGISVPLVFVGSYFGFKKDAVTHPVRTNKIPRQVPAQAWYMQPLFSVLIGGILPFGAVFIELFFILTSMWLHQVYYIFGVLFIVFIILILTCAEITIVLCYFQLCSEDYHWWWRSYLTSGSSAIYLLMYSTFYFFTKLDMSKTVPTVMYFGYMTMVSYSFFILTGTIGFVACFLFVRAIYASVKID